MSRVFIVSSHVMFGRGLESLLRQKTGLEIVGQEQNIERALKQIKELRPDVVILDYNNPPHHSAPDIMRILSAGLGIKVIGLSLEDNHIHIYQATRWIAQGVEDLMAAIEENSQTSHYASP